MISLLHTLPLFSLLLNPLPLPLQTMLLRTRRAVRLSLAGGNGIRFSCSNVNDDSSYKALDHLYFIARLREVRQEEMWVQGKSKETSYNFKMYKDAPWSCLASVVVDDPSAFWCVVFFCWELKAPERAPKRFRFSPAYYISISVALVSEIRDRRSGDLGGKRTYRSISTSMMFLRLDILCTLFLLLHLLLLGFFLGYGLRHLEGCLRFSNGEICVNELEKVLRIWKCKLL
jgi:hypothetical protein